MVNGRLRYKAVIRREAIELKSIVLPFVTTLSMHGQAFHLFFISDPLALESQHCDKNVRPGAYLEPFKHLLTVYVMEF